MKKYVFIIIGAVLLVLVVGTMVFVRPGAQPAGEEHSSEVQTDNSNSGDTSAPISTTEVDIVNFDFAPKNIVVKKGDTVTWTNQDTARHNVEFTSGSLEGEKSPLLSKSESYQFTFNETGTFDYICSPHPYMKATVTVEE